MQNKKKSTSRNRVSLKAIKKTKFGLSQLLKKPSEKKSQNKSKKVAEAENKWLMYIYVDVSWMV